MDMTVINEVVETINLMGNFEAKLQNVRKPDSDKAGICVRDKASDVGVVIYLEQLEADATTVGEVTGKVLEIFEKEKRNISQVSEDAKKIMEKIKSLDVHARLVPRHEPRHVLFLNGKVTREFLDMNIVYYVCVSKLNGSIGSYTIDTSMCNACGVTEEELFKGALNNITDDIVVHRNLSSVLTSFGEFHIDGVENLEEIFAPVTVLTNRSHTFGASLIIKDEVLNKVMERMNTDELIILPSSVNEVLVINANTAGADIASYREMVKCVNDDSGFKPSEILSYSVYTYNKKDGLRIAE